MLRIPRSGKRRRSESTIALINIVFLMLIFFLIVGTLAPPLDGDVNLIRTTTSEPVEPPDALVILADGKTRYRGQAVDLGSFVNDQRSASDEDTRYLRILADRNLPARTLIEITSALYELGAKRVVLITERGEP